MNIRDPHFLHMAAYLILTVMAVRIGLRVLQTSRFTRLVVRDGTLRESKARLIELLSLEAIEVSPLEAALIVTAHVLLVTASGLLFLVG